jgi:hypothetical protein
LSGGSGHYEEISTLEIHLIEIPYTIQTESMELKRMDDAEWAISTIPI